MYSILVITDDEQSSLLVRTLSEATDGPFEIRCETLLCTALDYISKNRIDIILAKLDLPDNRGIGTFFELFACVPQIPIMTLAEHDGESLAREAVQNGAQGYLTKGHYRSSLLPQAIRNIIERKQVEEALYKEHIQSTVVLNCIGDAVISVDTAGIVIYLNPAAESLTGWLPKEACGNHITDVLRIIDSETRNAPSPHPVVDVLQNGMPRGLSATATLIRKDGYEVAVEDAINPIVNKQGKSTGVVMVFRDVSESRTMGERMKHLANHDYLTNLPNRVLLTERLIHEISRACRNGTRIAVLFLDVDHFKHINDSLGHDVGDDLLKLVALRLCTCVRRIDTVCRLGGDEFVILLSDDVNSESISLVAEKIRETLAQPHTIAEHELYITVSMGISIFPDDGQDVGNLLKNADTAMYIAKEKGRDNFQFFNAKMNIRAIQRQLVESSLRHALAQQQFVLNFQPKVDLITGNIVAAEALLRWNHPEWGMVSPIKFINVAEECGLIIPIGRWVLEQACMQAKRWQDSGNATSYIAVNISALEFRQPDFLQQVEEILRKTQLAPNYLQLEITESVMMRDVDASAIILKKLKNIGISIAVDDFGTGYSSLSYLKTFPIDVLKIDRSFVRDISAPEEDGTLVTAIIAMGISLKLLVIAEGIENECQLNFLKEVGCIQGQGYLFSMPLSADKFLNYFNNFKNI